MYGYARVLVIDGREVVVSKHRFRRPLAPEVAAARKLRPLQRRHDEPGDLETLGRAVDVIEPDKVIEQRIVKPMTPLEMREKVLASLVESDAQIIRAVEDLIERQDKMVAALRAAGIDTREFDDLPRAVREKIRLRKRLRKQLNSIRFDG